MTPESMLHKAVVRSYGDRSVTWDFVLDIVSKINRTYFVTYICRYSKILSEVSFQKWQQRAYKGLLIYLGTGLKLPDNKDSELNLLLIVQVIVKLQTCNFVGKVSSIL